MTKTFRPTAAQAMVKWLAAQKNEVGERFIEGVWAIFGHGNVTGLGEALYGVRRPVSRYFDRNLRPEHLLSALPRAM